MIEVIWTLVIASLKMLGMAIAAYLFYYRVWDYARAVWFYKAQGEHVC